jgi:hypothetical protein
MKNNKLTTLIGAGLISGALTLGGCATPPQGTPLNSNSGPYASALRANGGVPYDSSLVQRMQSQGRINVPMSVIGYAGPCQIGYDFMGNDGKGDGKPDLIMSVDEHVNRLNFLYHTATSKQDLGKVSEVAMEVGTTFPRLGKIDKAIGQCTDGNKLPNRLEQTYFMAANGTLKPAMCGYSDLIKNVTITDDMGNEIVDPNRAIANYQNTVACLEHASKRMFPEKKPFKFGRIPMFVSWVNDPEAYLFAGITYLSAVALNKIDRITTGPFRVNNELVEDMSNEMDRLYSTGSPIMRGAENMSRLIFPQSRGGWEKEVLN